MKKTIKTIILLFFAPAIFSYFLGSIVWSENGWFACGVMSVVSGIIAIPFYLLYFVIDKWFTELVNNQKINQK